MLARPLRHRIDMGTSHLSEILSVPSLLSLARAPLAVAFPFLVDRPVAALAIVAASALSDVLDGWTARRFGRATATGAVLDPVMDKLFVATVVVTLVVTRRLSLPLALLLGSRDVLEVPLVIWLALDRQALARRSARLKSNAFGKVVTVLQFGTVVAALLAMPFVGALALASGISGVIAGASYWARPSRRNGAAPRKPNGPRAPLSAAT